jgi:hypothetical protein
MHTRKSESRSQEVEMDLAAPLRPEVLRPILTLVVPGAIGLAPFLSLATIWFPGMAYFADEHRYVTAGIIGVTVLALGFLLEDLGTVVEVKLIDPGLYTAHPNLKQEWKQYLQLELDDEIIGQRYLRTKITQLKFELALMISIVLGWAGLSMLQALRNILPQVQYVTLGAVVLAAVVLLCKAATTTADLLAGTRTTILQAVADREARAARLAQLMPGQGMFYWGLP